MRSRKIKVFAIMTMDSNEAPSQRRRVHVEYKCKIIFKMLIIFGKIVVFETSSQCSCVTADQTPILLRCPRSCSDVRHELEPSESVGLATSGSGSEAGGGQS